MRPNYLLVDDDDVFRSRVARALIKRGFSVMQAASAAEALSVSVGQEVDRALIDLKMPGTSGLELLPKLRQCNPQIKIVMLTGYGSIATTQSAIKGGAHSYLTKPCDIDHILAAFEEQELLPTKIPAPSLAQVEWEHIQRVLKDNSGNVSHAAKALGMNRRSLQRKLLKSPRLQ